MPPIGIFVELWPVKDSWSQPFLAAGWECIGVSPVTVPYAGTLIIGDPTEYLPCPVTLPTAWAASPPCGSWFANRLPWAREWTKLYLPGGNYKWIKGKRVVPSGIPDPKECADLEGIVQQCGPCWGVVETCLLASQWLQSDTGWAQLDHPWPFERYTSGSYVLWQDGQNSPLQLPKLPSYKSRIWQDGRNLRNRMPAVLTQWYFEMITTYLATGQWGG